MTKIKALIIFLSLLVVGLSATLTVVLVKNANNPNAGVDLTAINVNPQGVDTWDQNSDPHQGPEVHINAVDDETIIELILPVKTY